MGLEGRLILGEETSGLRLQMVAVFERGSRGQSMKLLRPQKRMADLLQITKLYTTFEIFEDEAEALASFAK